jgi:8-oxo-dGTP diphosphatase
MSVPELEHAFPSPGPQRFGSALLVVDGERLLLGRRAKEPHRGKWVLPGGKIGQFESIANAGKRELLEETGLIVEVTRPVGVVEIINPPREHRVVFYNWARVSGGELKAASDTDELRWCSRADLPSLELTPAVRDVLIEVGWLDGSPAVGFAMALSS